MNPCHKPFPTVIWILTVIGYIASEYFVTVCMTRALLVNKTAQKHSEFGEWPLQFTGVSDACIPLLQNHTRPFCPWDTNNSFYATDPAFTRHSSLSPCLEQVMWLAETSQISVFLPLRGLAPNLACIDLADETEICPRMSRKIWCDPNPPSFPPQVCAI